jgi:perosamine synthetase
MIPIYTPRIYKESVIKAIESGWVSSHGEFIQKTTDILKKTFNIPYVVLMNNGTSATHMLLKALKFKHPDIKQIYVPNNVFVAVWNTVLYEFKKEDMLLLDMDPHTLNMRTDEKYIRSLQPNSAVMIVHNVGNIVNVPRLKRIRPDLVFIEDNCEGLFGKYEGIYSGMSEASLCSSVSFFANKTIMCGEGGAFFTHDKDVYDFIYCTINHGFSGKKYIYKELGYNYRMTNIQAALLYDQLIHKDEILKDKRCIFELYKHILGSIYVGIPKTEECTEKSNWMFICAVSKSYEEVEEFMKEKGIDIRPFFYDIRAHAHLSDMEGPRLNTDKTYIMLPSYPDLEVKNVRHISECLLAMM